MSQHPQWLHPLLVSFTFPGQFRSRKRHFFVFDWNFLQGPQLHNSEALAKQWPTHKSWNKYCFNSRTGLSLWFLESCFPLPAIFLLRCTELSIFKLGCQSGVVRCAIPMLSPEPDLMTYVRATSGLFQLFDIIHLPLGIHGTTFSRHWKQLIQATISVTNSLISCKSSSHPNGHMKKKYIAQLNVSKSKYEVLQTFLASWTNTNKVVGRLIHSSNYPVDSYYFDSLFSDHPVRV